MIYIFHRAGSFYPITLRNDAEAVANAHANPGTLKVTDSENRVVFDAEVVTSADVAAWVVRAVAELPDRNSPEGWPEAMLVTHEELHQIVLDAIAQWVDIGEVAACAALSAPPAPVEAVAWSRAIAQEERACRAEDALTDLVNQIRKTSPVDDHGHNLTMNMAYLKAVELLDTPPTTQQAEGAKP